MVILVVARIYVRVVIISLIKIHTRLVRIRIVYVIRHLWLVIPGCILNFEPKEEQEKVQVIHNSLVSKLDLSRTIAYHHGRAVLNQSEKRT